MSSNHEEFMQGRCNHETPLGAGVVEVCGRPSWKMGGPCEIHETDRKGPSMAKTIGDKCSTCKDWLRDCLCEDENVVCHICGDTDCFICDICEESYCNCDCD